MGFVCLINERTYFNYHFRTEISITATDQPTAAPPSANLIMSPTSTNIKLRLHFPVHSMACLIPSSGSKGLSISHRQRNSRTIRIQIVERIGNVWVTISRRIHEPLRRIHLLRQNQSKKDNQRRDVQPSVQTRRRDIIVLCPPALELALQESIKENSHGAPAQVDVDRSRWDLTRSAKNEGPVQISDGGARESFRSEPGDDGQNGTEKPVPLERGVDSAGAKDTTGSDHAPYNGRCEEDGGTGAGVVVWLVGFTDTRNCAECPVEDGDLDDAGPQACRYLGCKSYARLRC